MNKVKLIFCLFLFILSCLYIKTKIEDINMIDSVLSNDNSKVLNLLIGTNTKDPSSLLDLKNKSTIMSLETKKESSKVITKEEKIEKFPEVYIFNTHQTEEYASNIYNITPTVVTVSNILQDELKNLNISSLVETKNVSKEVKRRGLDYTGTYTVSFEYLKQRKKQYPTLKYFFDIHRDSVTGSPARVKIKGQNYATMMFLVGANYDGYEKNVKNLKIMEKYLKKHYPNLVRDTYYQKRSSFNQEYNSKMFLVELGGPDNTLEEVYNTTKALAKSINYYMEETR